MKLNQLSTRGLVVLCAVLLCAALVPSTSYGVAYLSTTTGAWQTPATWGGSGFPTSTLDSATIANGVAVTSTTADTIGALNIGTATAGTLNLNSGANLSTTGLNMGNTAFGGASTLTIAAGATLSVNGNGLPGNVGDAGPINFTQTGGSFNYTGVEFDTTNNFTASNANFNITGGTFTANTQYGVRIRVRGQGANVFNLGGGVGTATMTINSSMANAGLVIGSLGAIGSGRFNLNANGVLSTGQVTSGWDDTGGSLYFNGGKLVVNSATFANDFFMLQSKSNLQVSAGGAIIDTNGFSAATTLGNTFTGFLHDASGPAIDGGITKLGLGTLTLRATNTYTGDTTVSAGTLSFTTATLPSTGDVIIAAGALLNLNFAGTDTVASLKLGLLNATPGIWGSLASAAPNKSALITGTGLLNVLALPADAAPEPNSLALLACGLGLVAWRKRRARVAR